jgi:hypothetical protein
MLPLQNANKLAKLSRRLLLALALLGIVAITLFMCSFAILLNHLSKSGNANKASASKQMMVHTTPKNNAAPTIPNVRQRKKPARMVHPAIRQRESVQR